MVVVTGNPHKFEEAASKLASCLPGAVLRRCLAPLRELQADSLDDVAVSKVADALSLGVGKVVAEAGFTGFLVEDTGFFLDAYPGFPGVYSAHVQRTLGNNGVLRLLRDSCNRKARFEAVLAYNEASTGLTRLFHGVVPGVVAREARGTGGFGYDPIFEPEGGGGLTYAEMSQEEKNATSHRAKALEGLAAYLKGDRDAGVVVKVERREVGALRWGKTLGG
ncbi:MAG: XTP/dITP diphosphatase [Promethearchaeota archaeon]